jgi:hypothetical protein
MAIRINWQKFVIGPTLRDDFFPGMEFGSNDGAEKKKLICEKVLNSSIRFESDSALSSKYKRLLSHLEIDDKSNSLRIIGELLLLVSISSDVDNKEYRFLELLKNSL